MIKNIMMLTPIIIQQQVNDMKKPFKYAFNPKNHEIKSDSNFTNGYFNIKKSKNGGYTNSIKYQCGIRIKTKIFRESTAKQTYIEREKFKSNNTKLWFHLYTRKDFIYRNDPLINEIKRRMIVIERNNWTKTKELIKRMVKEKQIEEWKDDAHGRILKRYQDRWNYNKTFTKVYDKEKGYIRKMRLGCSELADHKGYQYNDPNRCPVCKKNEIETNEHFLERCKNYQKERTDMHNKLSGVLIKEYGIPLNTKTLLGFKLIYKSKNLNQKNLLKKNTPSGQLILYEN